MGTVDQLKAWWAASPFGRDRNPGGEFVAAVADTPDEARRMAEENPGLTVFSRGGPVPGVPALGSQMWSDVAMIYAGAVTVLHKAHRAQSKRLTVAEDPLLIAWNEAMDATVRLGAHLGKSAREVWDDVEWGVYLPSELQAALKPRGGGA